ncbi:hypothetical protein GOB57_23915 [Sinorhizobium meliloti]|nr:hypothetical protein [Sinorhizobium meliloti]
MTSGRKTFNSFSDQRAVLERQARTHADAIHTAERRMQTIVQRQGELWKKLAAIHINTNLELPASVRESMDGRHEKIEATKVQVERIKTNLSSLKRMRSSTARERASIAATLASAHAAISTRFEADARVVELRRRIAGLTQAFSEAADKKERAVAELAHKRVTYEDDELFGYLRRRGFGTPAYSAWFPLMRALDAALARATNFNEEQANYDLLLAVPGWVDERIAALAPGQQKAQAEFSEIERAFFGELDQEKLALAAKDGELRDIDHAIEAEDNFIAIGNKFLSDSALAEDSELKRIVADFSALLSKTGFYDLKRLAGQTQEPEDDKIVVELQSLMDELADLTRAVDAEKSELFVLERKVKSFEQVERHLRSKGWNSSDHRFNGVNADQLSNQLATDTFTPAVVIGMLNNAHDQPRRNDYGSSNGGSGYAGSGYGGSSRRSDDGPTFTTSDSFGGGGSDSFTTSDSF